jgi:DNA-directed RNA polymerase specialized sigma24 family protein
MGELARRIEAGERAAAEELFDFCGAPLFHTAVGVSLDPAAATAACEKIFAYLRELSRGDSSDLRKTLFRALRAELQSTARARRGRAAYGPPVLQAAEVGLPESFVEKTEEMLRRLKEPEREILLLRHVGGLSAAEIADVTSERFDLVQRRLEEASDKAKRILAPADGEPTEIEIWLRRVRFRAGATGFRARALEAFATHRTRRPRRRGLRLALLLLLLLAAAAAWAVSDPERWRWLRELTGR